MLVTNCPDPIEGLYDMYLEGEEVPQIVEIIDNNLDLDLGLGDRLADPNLEF